MRAPAAISQRPHRVLIPGVAWLTYLVGFGPLHNLFETHAGIFAFVPLVLTAWHWGSVAGLVAGLAALGATVVLSALVIGTSLTSWLSAPGLLGTAAFVLVGYAVGRLRDLHTQRDREVDQRLRVETTLREREARLRLVNDITKKIRTDESLDSIIRAVVDGVGGYFPNFETSYATADLNGFNAVCTRRVTGDIDATLRRFEAPISQDYLDWVTGNRVLSIEDISTDTLAGVHLDTLVSAGVRAYLSAPIPHGKGVVGLLAVHGNDTHRWTEQEKAVVRDVADVLAVALEDATRKQHLLESEEKFRMLAEHSAMNISLVQRRGTVYANPAMRQMTGYSESELRELDFTEVLVAPEHRSLAREWAARRFEGERL